MQVQLSESFEIVTEDSARDGEAAERGFIREREIVQVREAIDALRECVELSTWPCTLRTMTGHEWASTEMEQDYRTGAYESRSVHLARADGQRLAPRQLFRLFRAAGLVKGTI